MWGAFDLRLLRSSMQIALLQGVWTARFEAWVGITHESHSPLGIAEPWRHRETSQPGQTPFEPRVSSL